MYADFSSTSVRGREEAVSILRPIGSFKSCLPDHKTSTEQSPNIAILQDEQVST